MEWQPIETAPKDGSKVLTTTGNYPEDVMCDRYHPDKKRWDYGRPNTHWMPLPTPPNTIKDQIENSETSKSLPALNWRAGRMNPYVKPKMKDEVIIHDEIATWDYAYKHKIEKYEHHGTEVAVASHLKGKHGEHCLCFADCKHFKPNTDQNCDIAQANFEVCMKHSICAPVWECPKYESKN